MAKIPEQPNLFKRRLSSKDYYEAISSAEFRDGRSYDKRWIRTEANPPKDVSTAFGPVQITLLKALDYARRGLLSEKAVSAVNQMIPMYNKFKAKDSKGGPYGYGGSGNFRAELKPLY